MCGILLSGVGKKLITSVVKNEALRNVQVIEQYEVQLAAFPKGSLISRKGYFYLKFRKGGKVCDEYGGICMILYHGSTELVDRPEIRKRKREDNYLDFGAGFYTTTSYEQAERWARIKMRREKKNIGYVSIYEFDLDAAEKTCGIKRFASADLKWLTFVVANRSGKPTGDNSDIHIGPVADDNVYQSIRYFETGVYDAEYTIKKLKTEVLHDQWTFHTEKSLLCVKFIKSQEIR